MSLLTLVLSTAFVWVEAEDFAEKGDWVVETQFTHKMGSAYLLCPGPDSPRERAATTSVTLPSAGTWTVWARTKDWLPEFCPASSRWWSTDVNPSARIFEIRVYGPEPAHKLELAK